METKESGQKMTISDVAEALNISKTTVSRAISGKGRIGAETRRRVLEYIEEHNYKPSVIAKGRLQRGGSAVLSEVPDGIAGDGCASGL